MSGVQLPPLPQKTRPCRHGNVAQVVEQRTENPCVGGSTPSIATHLFFSFLFRLSPIKGALFVLATLTASCVWPSEKNGASTSAVRIVTLSPTLTEIVYALGDTVVGRDLLSSMPKEALAAPSVGYMRALSDEGILSLKPTLVLATSEAGPAAVLEKVAAKTKLILTPEALDVDSAVKTIEMVAAALNKSEKGNQIIANLRTKCDSAAKIVEGLKVRPRVLYLNSRGDAASLYAHGKATTADFYITGAGGQNVVDFAKIKPFSEEALINADPDILLFDQDTFERLGGLEGLAASALFSKLKAVKEKRVVVAPTAHFFGVGPYAGELLLNFQKAFYP